MREPHSSTNHQGLEFNRATPLTGLGWLFFALILGCSQAPDRSSEAPEIGVSELQDSANRASLAGTISPEYDFDPMGSVALFPAVRGDLEAPIPLPEGVAVGHTPPNWYANTWDANRPEWVRILLWVLYSIVALICVYAVRHYIFTYNRLFGDQRHPYLPIEVADWPSLSILIPCHNEERVVASILEALLKVDYPVQKMKIVPVNDRSTDGTREIIDRFGSAFPDQVRPLHRTSGKPGKAAALQDAIRTVSDDIILIFDADYLPGRDLIKRLAAPFLDPQIGAVMGRVVPVNTPRNLLTRLLDLERAGGYQVDQQARMNLKLIAQYGGTVGGVRMSALNAVGGWRDDSLAEDTDITFRLVLGGWKIAYSNRYECYEEVPETWPTRIKQIQRWAKGHTDAAVRYIPGLITQPRLTLRERVDGILLLGTYFMSPILLFGWLLAIMAFYLGANPFLGAIAILSVAAYNTIGNFAAFFEIGAAAHLDGTQHRIRILPMVLGGFLVSLVSTSSAVLAQLWPGKKELQWDKTERYRSHLQVRPVAMTAEAEARAQAQHPVPARQDRAAISAPAKPRHHAAPVEAESPQNAAPPAEARPVAQSAEPKEAAPPTEPRRNTRPRRAASDRTPTTRKRTGTPNKKPGVRK